MPQQRPADLPSPDVVPPVPPVPPAPPAARAGAPVIGQTNLQSFGGVPTTAREMRALRRRRSELSDQLTSVSSRRSELVRQMERLDPGARDGIRQRIALLDQRILQLEGDIARTGQLVVQAPADLLTTSESPPSFPFGDANVNYTAVSIVFTLFVLMPMALALARLLWRRASRPAPAPRATSPEDSQRLLRVEQAIDTIAVEVERISEGQRFVTHLLAEGPASSRVLEGVPAGQSRQP